MIWVIVCKNRYKAKKYWFDCFLFLSTELFQTDGELIPKTKCDYQFESTATTNGTQRLRGRFYSPQYPSTYPKNTLCSYTFVGQPNERVKIILEEVRLQKSDLRSVFNLFWGCAQYIDFWFCPTVVSIVQMWSLSTTATLQTSHWLDSCVI